MSAAKRPLTLATVLAAAGVATMLTLPGGTAFADTNPPPANLGDSSIASGNQVAAPVSVPVNVCGIAIAILGSSNAGCEGGATATVPQAAPATAGQSGTGVGSGNNVSAPVSLPVDVCGVSVSVLGSSQSGCQGTSTVGTGPGNPGNPPPPNWPPSGPPGGKPPGGGHHHKPPRHHPPHHPPGGHHGGGGGGNHGGTSGHGKSTGTGTTTLTTSSGSQSGNGQSGTSLSSGTLPTTGINLLGISIAAIGSLMAGVAALVTSRRRSAQEA
jgi:LPXTG-motif cell wall-anchored protein